MRCQLCKRYFTPHPKPKGYDEATKLLAVRLYLEGNSFRGVAKVLRLSYNSVINWVNEHEAGLPATVTDQNPAQDVETDELFSFIGQKKAGSTS
jgi:transposase